MNGEFLLFLNRALGRLAAELEPAAVVKVVDIIARGLEEVYDSERAKEERRRVADEACAQRGGAVAPDQQWLDLHRRLDAIGDVLCAIRSAGGAR
jgi:hypothetical protein